MVFCCGWGVVGSGTGNVVSHAWMVGDETRLPVAKAVLVHVWMYGTGWCG